MRFIAVNVSLVYMLCEVFDTHCLPLLQDVIGLFAGTPDPDYPGHVLLEQYQAQVWSEPGTHKHLSELMTAVEHHCHNHLWAASRFIGGYYNVSIWNLGLDDSW